MNNNHSDKDKDNKDSLLNNSEQDRDFSGSIKDGHDSSESAPLSEIEILKKERDEYLNAWKRAKADLINYKKEEATRLENLIKYSNESFIKDLLTVMNSFDLAIAAEPNNKGAALIRSQLESFLSQFGVKQIKTLAEKFNPRLHEAIAEEESDRESGTIIEEIERGWLLYEKVLKPAKVKVAK